MAVSVAAAAKSAQLRRMRARTISTADRGLERMHRLVTIARLRELKSASENTWQKFFHSELCDTTCSALR